MKSYPKYEVAISDAERAEIEAIFIELMRERAAAPDGSEVASTLPTEFPNKNGSR